MTEPRSSRRPSAVQAWRTFWFRPQPAYTLGLVRIAFGAVAIGWAFSLLFDLHQLFGPHGVEPQQPGGAFRWGIFAIWTGDRALTIGWAVLLVSSIALTLGWHTRLAALAVFVLIFSFEYRNPWVFNSGDLAMRIEALFLALSPCGAALSLDQARSSGKFWSAQQRPCWPVRLMQVQLSLIYFASVQAKLNGNAWPQGTAVSYALRLQDMVLLPVPHWLSNSALLMNAATWATIALELSIAILVWNRRLRPWVLAAGVVMHTMIMITIAVGFFTLAVFVLYLAFVPPETVERLPHSTKHLAAKIMPALRQRRPSKSQADYQDSKEPEGAVAEPDADSPTGPRISADGAQ
ncbi:MAG: HTTM domain-containing protein [Mycobacterium sp.]|nr:HTTM domain-containing protein [Mycobacterium sp.]